MKKFIFLLAVLFSIISCQENRTDVKDRSKTVLVSPEDATMNGLIAEARSTSHIFFAQMQKREKNERDFSVKYPFATDPGSIEPEEHIWLVNIRIKDGVYYGTISNEPYHVKKFKMGDLVAFDPKKLSDWKYIKRDYLVGGKSIIYLLKNLPEVEKNEVLKQLDFKIKEFENGK